jgi:hypothetical protein
VSPSQKNGVPSSHARQRWLLDKTRRFIGERAIP